MTKFKHVTDYRGDVCGVRFTAKPQLSDKLPMVWVEYKGDGGGPKVGEYEKVKGGFRFHQTGGHSDPIKALDGQIFPSKAVMAERIAELVETTKWDSWNRG